MLETTYSYCSSLFQFINIETIATGNAAFVPWTHLGMSDDNDQRRVLTERWLYKVKMRQGKKIDREAKKDRERTKAVIRGPKVSEQGMLVPNEIGSF